MPQPRIPRSEQCILSDTPNGYFSFPQCLNQNVVVMMMMMIIIIIIIIIMLRLYITLVRSKIEYASVDWNSITSPDANKLERIQQRFAALCF
jgi:uncharacterized membrane protein